MEMLSAEGLCKYYQNGAVTEVIKKVSLKVNDGEFVVITGKSGSGKSTLLYLLSGMEKPDNGSVFFDGVCINDLNDSQISKIRRTGMGFVFQFYNLLPSFNVWDNVVIPLKLEGNYDKNVENTIKGYLNEVGLAGKEKKFPHELSGGEQQRVAIVRALAIDPDLIFADEPTGNLDSETGLTIIRLFEVLNKKFGKTIIMVTHDDTVVNTVKCRHIRMVNGKIEAD